MYRRHALPIRCPRCGTVFESDELRDEHAVQEISCQVGKPEPVDGYTKKQETQLRSRKRPKGQTDEDRWRDMYRILFLDGHDGDVPSPCKKNPFQIPGSLLRVPDNLPLEQRDKEILCQFAKYLELELPKRVKKELRSPVRPPLLDDEIESVIKQQTNNLLQVYLGVQQSSTRRPQTSNVNDVLSGTSHDVSHTRYPSMTTASQSVYSDGPRTPASTQMMGAFGPTSTRGLTISGSSESSNHTQQLYPSTLR